jgi:maltose alpha-D-glucosyltransferase/alpha-amylase
VWSYKRINVAAQQRDPNSMLNWTERMIRLRKECPEIGWGNLKILNTGTRHVLALRYDWRTNSVLTLHNFSEKPQTVRLDVGVPGGQRLINMIIGDHSDADANGKHTIVIEEYGYRWFRVGSLNYRLIREKY